MVINEAEIVDNVPSFNAVHPSILKKSWIVVEPEKALLKILKRLREKEKNVVVDLPYTAQTPNTTEEKSRSFYPQMIPSNASQPEHKFNNAYPVAELSNHPATTTHYSFAGDNVDVGQEAIDARQVNNWSSVDVFHPQSHITSDINTTPPQCTDKSMEQQTVAREGLLSKYLEGSGLNLETDAFLQAPTPQPDIDATDELCEYTLPQWIMNSKPDISLDIAATSAQSHEHVDTFIKPALLIALKLTECMLEAERDENSGHGNPIPLASIAPENVLIRARKYQHAIGESDEVRENIEFVWVMSIVGDESAIGTVMARLFAVGKVLYELFSTKYTSKEYDLPTFPMTSMDSINLFNEADNGRNTQNNRRWHRGQAGNQNSTYIARLESTGVPMPLCVLIVNLLECRHDPFCDDDAYSSFADLQLDLQMMLDNPSSFLDDMGHIINNPKLAIPDKLFGRDEELSKLEELYQSHINSGQTTGVVISGGAGAGKSKLASHLQKVTTSSNGYFLSTKFDHNQMSLKPLSTVAYMIDALCDILLNNSQPTQLSEVENELTGALGSQPSLLGISPGLRKLMPSSESVVSAASNCVDNAVSMRYQCGELLRVISSYLKPITIVIDDIQFADQTSLLLVGSMLVNTRRNSAFFCLCHRDDEASMSGPFNEWLASLSEFSLESIKLVAITPEAVNNLISEALHLSPRLTRPLSTMLHHKTRGNPLFLRQLLDSLTEQGYIFVDMKQRRWSWDLDKITELEISESVLALLMSDIKRLPSDLQFGLQVAACIGACVTETMLDYLMIGIGINLKETLQQASQKGFMIDLVGSAMFRFAHDKIRQAAYELMSDQQRRENHMRFGLALCTQSLDNIAQDEELFFAAVNQINLGGPTAVQEPSQRKVMAELNLKAGRRAIELSDYNTAFTLFEHGISFLEDDDWTLNYQLSLALYDAVAEAALIRNCLSAVTHYTDLVVLHGRCFDDKLHCKIIECLTWALCCLTSYHYHENFFHHLRQA